MARTLIFAILGVLTAASLAAVVLGGPGWWAATAVLVAALLVAVRDVVQGRHSILRNFPLLGHMRFFMETIRPEIQQYFIERNVEGKPFNRDTRSLIYARAKGDNSHKAFGTERDVNAMGYEYLLQSTAPVPTPQSHPRVRLGGPDCTRPYDISLMNISSMSFGALSKNAVLAMNKGAALGGFAQETGEGGLSKYHLEHGADVIWEIGSGYFGTRDSDGHFCPDTFTRKAARPEVKAVSIKLSQGAKPGLGGVLPASKITDEIAEARGVPMGRDCVSPASHSAFTTPAELMAFVARLRELSDGKPIGFKLCVGSRTDVLAICKAMLEANITPDFIVVDGSEGGTGAAPLEYQDHVGTPLTEGLMLVHNALVGVGLRDKIRVGAAGKVASGSDVVKRLIQGADFTLSARAMMMATGCIQAQRCHTNTCPVGVATQDPRLMRAIKVDDKGDRVAKYHHGTVDEAVQLIASMGCTSPDQLTPRMLRRRVDHLATRSYAKIYHWLRRGELLTDPPRNWSEDWDLAHSSRFGELVPPPAAQDPTTAGPAGAGPAGADSTGAGRTVPAAATSRNDGPGPDSGGTVGRPEGEPAR